MKRCGLSLLLACLSVAVLLLAAGCIDNTRDPVRDTNSQPGIIDAGMLADHRYYKLGESVRVRVILKNVSRQIQTLGNDKGPVIDLLLHSNAGDRWWSQEHPEDVERLVTLKPGESYIVEWIVTPTSGDTYYFTAWWTDSEGDRPRMFVSAFYGTRPPGPMP